MGPTYAAKTGVDPALARSVLDGQVHKFIPIDQAVIAAQQKHVDAFAKLGLIPQLETSQEFDNRYNQVFFEENK